MSEVLLAEITEVIPVRGRGGFRRHPLNDAIYVYNVDGERTAKGKVRSELYGSASARGEGLVSRFALTRRDNRLIVTGLRLLIEDGEELGDDTDALIVRCLIRAGAWDAADRGSAIHARWEDPNVPLDLERLGVSAELIEACRLAIQGCLDRHGIDVLAHEVRIVNDLLRAAGTADAYGRLTRAIAFSDGIVIPAGSVVVIDLKTGVLRLVAGSPEYWMPYAVQLAVYAGGCRYEIEGELEWREPLPWAVHQGYGLIVHVGVEAARDTGVATAQLWKCDLSVGRRGADLLFDISDWNKQRPFAEQAEPAFAVDIEEHRGELELALEASLEALGIEIPAAEDVDIPAVMAEIAVLEDYTAQIREWLQSRVDVIGKHSVGARSDLGLRWPKEIPALRSSDAHTDDDLVAIESCLDDVEATHSVPFGPSKPGPARSPAEWLQRLAGVFPNSQLIHKEHSDVR